MSEKFGKIVTEHADADIPGIETVLEDDKLEEAEEFEMESDSADSKLALSAMLERPAAEDRAMAPSHTSDAKKQGSDEESRKQAAVRWFKLKRILK